MDSVFSDHDKKPDFIFTRKRLNRARPYFPSIGVDTDWLIQQNITPIGTTQNQDELFWDCPEGMCHDPSKDVPLETVNGFHEVVEALKKLPNSLLQAFRNQKDGGSTDVYFSTQSGRSLAVIGYYYYLLILEQTVDEQITLHEYAHLIDEICVRGMLEGYDYPPIWNLASELDQIFDTQGNLISGYAKTNTYEDFAEHFSYYVWKGTTSRKQATLYPEVQRRYTFLKEQLFKGVEYEDPLPPPITIVEGEVIDEKGFPVGDALVYSDKGFLVRTTYKGSFHIERIPEGEYIVWAEKNGYRQSESVSILVTLGQPVTLKLILTEEPKPPSLWLFIGVGLAFGIPLVYYMLKE